MKTAEDILETVQKEVSYMGNTPLTVTADSGPKFNRTLTMAQGPSLYISPKGSILLQIALREYAIVPAYPRLQQHALDLCKSSDYRDRERGAYMLRSYPDDKSIQMLTSLLKDEGVYRWNMSSNTACVVHMVRVAAYDTLRDLEVSVQKPLLEECQNR